MATGWSVLDALNSKSRAAVEETAKARFRTRDISIKKMYTNERNFYSMTGIERLAGEILAAGLIENLTVVYAPCDAGEYRIIAGERRFRALQMLVERGYSEFEMATCQIKSPADEHEETVQIILANGYRDKTIGDVLEEEKRLKEALQYMKANGLTLAGYKLDSGRLRDVIASMMNTTSTRIAQIESINNRLIPEMMEEVRAGRLTFSAAYEVSGMDEAGQRLMLERFKESGTLSLADVRDAKKAQKEADDAAAAERDAEDAQTASDAPEDAEGQEDTEDPGEGADGPEDTEDGEEYFDPQPERVDSICYSCARYSECHEKRSDVRACNAYIDKAEQDKTPEQRYDEEQAEIDAQTRRAMRDIQQQKNLDRPTEGPKVHEIKIGASFFAEVVAGQKGFELRKNDRDYHVGDYLKMMEYDHGQQTGQFVVVKVTYMLESYTGLVDGFCIMQTQIVEDLAEAGLEAAQGAGQLAAAGA